MLVSEFLNKLNNKNLLENQNITLKFDCFETCLNQIHITRFIDSSYQITCLNELMPVKFYEYETLEKVKNKIKKIVADSQQKSWKTLNIKEIQKENIFC